MKDNLLIVGEGQYGLIAKEIAESMGSFEKVSFLDCGENSESIESELELLSTENKYAFAAFAGAEARVEFTRKLRKYGYGTAILISPRAYVSPSAQIMDGAMAEPFAVISGGTVIGRNCFIGANATVGCGTVVGEASTICCGATVADNVTVMPMTTVGCGETLCGYTQSVSMRTPEGNSYCFEDGM